jgi:magnesium transporter
MLLGAACGGIVALAMWVWQGQGWAAVVIIISVLLSMITAALLGRFVPALLWVFRRDAKIASGPVVLAITDILTLTCYLGLAQAVIAFYSS